MSNSINGEINARNGGEICQWRSWVVIFFLGTFFSFLFFLSPLVAFYSGRPSVPIAFFF